MANIYLVRHAQASFNTDNYDRLSPGGIEQARLLGQYWAEQRLPIARAFSGPKQRQTHTCEMVQEAYSAAGLPFPAAAIIDELNEYPARAIMQRFAPILCERDDAIRVMRDAMEAARNTKGNGFEHAYQDYFGACVSHWVADSIADAEVENFAAFRERVRRGLLHMVEGLGRNDRVAAFTSGGFIFTSMQIALDCPFQKALDLQWQVKNGAVSEFHVEGGRIQLHEFNAAPHLLDPTHITYR